MRWAASLPPGANAAAAAAMAAVIGASAAFDALSDALPALRVVRGDEARLRHGPAVAAEMVEDDAELRIIIAGRLHQRLDRSWSTGHTGCRRSHAAPIFFMDQFRDQRFDRFFRHGALEMDRGGSPWSPPREGQRLANMKPDVVIL